MNVLVSREQMKYQFQQGHPYPPSRFSTWLICQNQHAVQQPQPKPQEHIRVSTRRQGFDSVRCTGTSCSQ